MGIDLNAIRNKLNKLQSVNSRVDVLWKPEAGQEHRIRLVPYQHNPDMPFIELYFHYGLNGKNYLSPRTFGDPDPLEEYAEKLRSTGDKDDYELSKKLRSKMRVYVPIIIRGQENEGVKFWGFGKTIYQELLEFMADEDYGDITSPTTGRDITVRHYTPEEAGNRFGETKIKVKPNVSPATDNESIAKKILHEQKDIFDIFKRVSYDELKDALAEWLNDGVSSDEDQESDSSPKSSTVSDITAEFDKMFESNK